MKRLLRSLLKMPRLGFHLVVLQEAARAKNVAVLGVKEVIMHGDGRYGNDESRQTTPKLMESSVTVHM